MEIGKLTVSAGFTTTDNAFHQSKLGALVHQQRLDLRGVVQSDDKYGTRAHLTAVEVADVVVRNADKIAELTRHYSKAIKKERTKGGATLAN